MLAKYSDSKQTLLRSVTAFLISTLILSGCATTYRLSYPGHKTFTDVNVARLRVGMSAEEIRSIFGEPDEEYTAEFGSGVGNEWKGRVWIYFTRLDPKLMYAKRYKKNVFVFYPAEGNMRLNHWEIEE